MCWKQQFNKKDPIRSFPTIVYEQYTEQQYYIYK